MADEPRLLGTQHFQRTVDDLKQSVAQLSAAAKVMKSAADASRAPQPGFRGVMSNMWNGSPRQTTAPIGGSPATGGATAAAPQAAAPSTMPIPRPAFPRPPLMGGQAAAAVNQGLAGPFSSFPRFSGLVQNALQLPINQNIPVFPRMDVSKLPPGMGTGRGPHEPYRQSSSYPREFPKMGRLALPPPGGGGGDGGGGGASEGSAPRFPRMAAAGATARNFVGAYGLGHTATALRNYSDAHLGENYAMENLAARYFRTSGMQGGFSADNTRTMARQMFANQNWGNDTLDRSAALENVRRTTGFTFGSDRYNQYTSALGSMVAMDPSRSAAEQSRGATSLSAAPSQNALMMYGIQTVDAQGRTRDPRDIAAAITSRIGGRYSSDTNTALSQIETEYEDQNSATNVSLQNLVRSGAITQEAAENVRSEGKNQDIARAKGVSDAEYRKLTEGLRTNDKDSIERLDELGILPRTAETRERELAAAKDATQAETLGGWSKGLQDATGVMELFTKAVTRFLEETGLGDAVGYASGFSGKAGSEVQGIKDTFGGVTGLFGAGMAGAGAARLAAPAVIAGGKAAGRGAASAARGIKNFFTGGAGGAGGPEDAQGNAPTQEDSRPVKLQWPFRAKLTSDYGPRSDPKHGRNKFHTGIDIANGSSGAPIVAAAAGVVTKATTNGGAYGMQTVIDHGQGIQTMYGHQSAIRVRVGQQVTAGETIGAVGNTGRSTGPHLHFEVWRDGTHTNPMPYLGGGGVSGSNGSASPDAATAVPGDQPSQAGLSGSTMSGTAGSFNEAAAIAAALSGGGVTRGSSQSPTPAGQATTEPSGGTPSVTIKGVGRERNATTIINTAQSMGMSNRDILIGLMTAMQESDLRNMANKKIPESYRYNPEGEGSDHDSVGIFQQRPKYWGTVAELMNPPISSRKFFDKLKTIGGRDRMQLTQAAQAVQRSAFPGHYAKHEPEARRFMAKYNLNAYNRGAWEVKGDELAQLHEGEMVVKRDTAKTIRDALLSEGDPTRIYKGGSSSSQVTLRFEPGAVVVRVNGAMTAESARTSGQMIMDAIAKDSRLKQIANGV